MPKLRGWAGDRELERPGGEARLRRDPAERGFAGELLEWRPVGPRIEAEIARAKYSIFASTFEVACWAEVRDFGGRRRVEIGIFASVRDAQAACELDAQRRLRREEAEQPVDVRVRPPRRAR